jgi:septin family protein
MVKTLFNFPEIVKVEGFPAVDSTTTTTRCYRASTIPTEAVRLGENQFNLSVVDTPGFGAKMDAMSTINPIVDYHSKSQSLPKKKINFNLFFLFFFLCSGCLPRNLSII